jgi:hypothetical protein
MIADQAHAALGMEAQAVEGDDARCFLAAMLQGMQAKGRQRRRIGMTQDAEDAALFMQRVAIQLIKSTRGNLMRNRLIHFDLVFRKNGRAGRDCVSGRTCFFT